MLRPQGRIEAAGGDRDLQVTSEEAVRLGCSR